MSANFVKRHCYGGWDWCFETDERSSPVSNVVKEYIESIEAENAKLRELVRYMWHLLFDWLFKNHEVPWKELEAAHDRIRELVIEVDE